MKLVLAAILLSSLSAFGSVCTDEIFKNEEFIGKDNEKNPLPETVIQCILNDIEFKKAQEVLCSKGQTDISPTYKTYFKYFQAFKAAEDAWKKNTDANQNSIFVLKARQAYDEMQRFLYMNETIASSQLNMYRAQSHCEGK